MNQQGVRVAAVIPNWNGLRFLQPLFADLATQSRPFDRIVVADNGSVDGSDRWAAESGAEVIRLNGNQGFAPAVNAGVRAARDSDLVAVLNNDLRLPSGWLGRMLDGIGAAPCACGRIVSAHNPSVLDATWDAVCRGGTALRCGSGVPDGGVFATPRQVWCFPFTAVLFRREWFLDLGGLDEEFGSYLEDVDFGLRSASGGHRGAYVPGAVCSHYGSGTLGRWNPKTVRQIARNQVLLLARHYPPELLREFGWQIAVANLLWGVIAIRRGRGLAWVQGKWDGIRNFQRFRRRGSASIRLLLAESEDEIRQLQTSAGMDWYWRWYFALT